MLPISPPDPTEKTRLKTQQDDLPIEWKLYEPHAKQSMIDEYNFLTSKGDCIYSNFLDFLSDKLEIEGYWEKTGLV